jgi:hypothetical protein
MMADIGDIVKLNGFNWVVANPVPSPSNAPWVRLLRNLSDDLTTSFVTGAASLEVIETPAYAIGQQVRVGGLPGEIVAMNADEATIALDLYHEPLKGGGHYLHHGRSTVPFWKLTLENKLNV